MAYIEPRVLSCRDLLLGIASDAWWNLTATHKEASQTVQVEYMAARDSVVL